MGDHLMAALCVVLSLAPGLVILPDRHATRGGVQACQSSPASPAPLPAEPVCPLECPP